MDGRLVYADQDGKPSLLPPPDDWQALSRVIKLPYGLERVFLPSRDAVYYLDHLNQRSRAHLRGDDFEQLEVVPDSDPGHNMTLSRQRVDLHQGDIDGLVLAADTPPWVKAASPGCPLQAGYVVLEVDGVKLVDMCGDEALAAIKQKMLASKNGTVAVVVETQAAGPASPTSPHSPLALAFQLPSGGPSVSRHSSVGELGNSQSSGAGVTSPTSAASVVSAASRTSFRPNQPHKLRVHTATKQYTTMRYTPATTCGDMCLQLMEKLHLQSCPRFGLCLINKQNNSVVIEATSNELVSKIGRMLKFHPEMQCRLRLFHIPPQLDVYQEQFPRNLDFLFDQTLEDIVSGRSSWLPIDVALRLSAIYLRCYMLERGKKKLDMSYVSNHLPFKTFVPPHVLAQKGAGSTRTLKRLLTEQYKQQEEADLNLLDSKLAFLRLYFSDIRSSRDMFEARVNRGPLSFVGLSEMRGVYSCPVKDVLSCRRLVDLADLHEVSIKKDTDEMCNPVLRMQLTAGRQAKVELQFQEANGVRFLALTYELLALAVPSRYLTVTGSPLEVPAYESTHWAYPFGWNYNVDQVHLHMDERGFVKFNPTDLLTRLAVQEVRNPAVLDEGEQLQREQPVDSKAGLIRSNDAPEKSAGPAWAGASVTSQPEDSSATQDNDLRQDSQVTGESPPESAEVVGIGDASPSDIFKHRRYRFSGDAAQMTETQLAETQQETLQETRDDTKSQVVDEALSQQLAGLPSSVNARSRRPEPLRTSDMPSSPTLSDGSPRPPSVVVVPESGSPVLVSPADDSTQPLEVQSPPRRVSFGSTSGVNRPSREDATSEAHMPESPLTTLTELCDELQARGYELFRLGLEGISPSSSGFSEGLTTSKARVWHGTSLLVRELQALLRLECKTDQVLDPLARIVRLCFAVGSSAYRCAREMPPHQAQQAVDLLRYTGTVLQLLARLLPSLAAFCVRVTDDGAPHSQRNLMNGADKFDADDMDADDVEDMPSEGTEVSDDDGHQGQATGSTLNSSSRRYAFTSQLGPFIRMEGASTVLKSSSRPVSPQETSRACDGDEAESTAILNGMVDVLKRASSVLDTLATLDIAI